MLQVMPDPNDFTDKNAAEGDEGQTPAGRAAAGTPGCATGGPPRGDRGLAGDAPGAPDSARKSES